VFLNGGSNFEENRELHKFLVSTYRVLLDGRISRIRPYAERILDGTVHTLDEVADQISRQFLRIDASAQVDRDWLKSSLNKVDKKRARRVFNAMLLPEKSLGWGAQGFDPLNFGQAARNYQVDHLIPERMRTENAQGDAEIDTLRNFAPLRTNQNRVAKTTSCSTKLASGGVYDAVLQNTPYHPYVQWLVQYHAAAYTAQLDDQQYLEPNQSPDIGDKRIEHIVEHLWLRI
jgi:hypothetical protein